MITAPRLPNERERLAELETFEILDTLPEATFDAITFLASEICEAPIALVSIVDEDRQWFKSKVGIDADETPRDLAFCAHAIHQPETLMIVPDATVDIRFSDSPLVTGEPSIRFYAGAPLVTKNGNALGTLCVIDRQPRRLTLEQERALNALSLQVVALLELRRSVRDLEIKQRELEQTSKQRETFMATVSHEIRTPLTAVVGYIELLRDPDLSNEARTEMLDLVSRQAGDVENLIEDLLIAARAEADSLTVATVPVNLGAQVAQVMEGLNPMTGDGIRVEGDPTVAAGDPARLRQVIRNLITNALRYGGPHVTVRTSTRDGVCHLEVIDDGEGIPESDRQRIFQPFECSNGGRVVDSSVGLGLPISRLLAEKMGGSLSYRFENGLSIFEVTLPAHHA